MSSPVDLTLFAHVCGRPEEELDLAQAALLIAECEYPGLDHERYLAQLDDLGESARALLEGRRHGEGADARLRLVLHWMYEELRFHGNEADYYDPRNSFLNDVLDRRTGIPITLGLVLSEVCDRAGLEARGVSFPGHFLVRVEGPRGPTFVDPFAGRILTGEDLRRLHTRGTPEQGSADDAPPSSRLLAAATKRQILYRVLNNLRGIYTSRSDAQRLRAVLERMQVLSPSDELQGELARLGGTRPWPSSGRTLN